MYKIIAIMGESGAGKDTIMQQVLAKPLTTELHEIVSCTTRAKRETEKDGVNYFFMAQNKFCDKILNHEMLEYTRFNGWFYGTSLQSVDENKINIGVFNPTGVRLLQQRADVELKIYRIWADDKTRLIRQLMREDHPNVKEIVRRFSADYTDFEELEDIPHHFLSNTSDLEMNTAITRIVNDAESWANTIKK
jgi:guanylate kinase